jgi:ADP-heptose:LPS heptosyltransferase
MSKLLYAYNLADTWHASLMNILSKLSRKSIKYVCLVLVDQLVISIPRLSKGRDVVLVRPDGIGDFVLWLDASRALTNHYQEQGLKVTLLANALWAQWASDLNVFDRVLPIDIELFDSSLMYRARMAFTLHKLNFAIAIQPIYSRRYLTDVVTYLCGASERIGWTGDSANTLPLLKRYRNRWYTKLIDAGSLVEMELIRNAQFVRDTVEPSYVAKVFDLRELENQSGERPNLPAFGVRPEEPFYILFPGGSWSGKRWPTSRFADLAERIYAETNWSGVICGGEKDRHLAKEICLQASVPLIDCSGATSLSQLTGLLSAASMLISNDTAAVHIAASVGTPTVCILGGGHYGRFLPYQVERKQSVHLPLVATYKMPCFNCDWNCIFPQSESGCVPCIENISADNVWSQVEKIVGNA